MLEAGVQQVEVPKSATDASSGASVIVTYTGNTDVVVEGTLDIPGASEEIVETENQLLPTRETHQQPKNGAPAYRQQLLLMYVSIDDSCFTRQNPMLGLRIFV